MRVSQVRSNSCLGGISPLRVPVVHVICTPGSKCYCANPNYFRINHLEVVSINCLEKSVLQFWWTLVPLQDRGWSCHLPRSPSRPYPFPTCALVTAFFCLGRPNAKAVQSSASLGKSSCTLCKHMHRLALRFHNERRWRGETVQASKRRDCPGRVQSRPEMCSNRPGGQLFKSCSSYQDRWHGMFPSDSKSL